jgi:rhodanese-related sulfurtransferase
MLRYFIWISLGLILYQYCYDYKKLILIQMKMIKRLLSILGIYLPMTSLGVMAQPTPLTIGQFHDLLVSTTQPQLLDARTPEEFAINHISGAINVNVNDSSSTRQIVATLRRDAPVFTYTINDGGRSTQLAKKLKIAGFSAVYQLPGGLINWVGSGYPIISNNGKGIDISSAQFKELVSQQQLVLVEYGSRYCGTCRKQASVLDTLQQRYLDQQVKIIKIDLNDSPSLIKAQQVKVIPALALYKDGQLKWQHTGLLNYSAITNELATQSESELH